MATLAQNVQRAINDFNSIENAIVQKGVPVPDGTPTSEYGEKILSIETGVDTSGDTVVPSALREGFTAHNAAGQEITGTIPNYDGGSSVEITSPEGATLNTAGTYCEGNIEVVPKLQSKTATTGEIVTADAGYVGLESVDTNPAYEAGQREFMEEYLDYGKRTHFDYAFAGQGWTNDTFKPTRNITPREGVYMMFSGCMITDIPNSLEKCGVVFDSSDYNGDFLYFVYNNFHTVRFPALDTRSSALLKNVFHNARSSLKIDKFILRDDGSQIFDSAPISYCVALEDLTIEGKIGSDNFNVSHSPLNKASLISVINALSDTTTGLTVTLRLAAVNTAFETSAGAADGSTSEEWTALIATKPNWTINLINS